MLDRRNHAASIPQLLGRLLPRGLALQPIKYSIHPVAPRYLVVFCAQLHKRLVHIFITLQAYCFNVSEQGSRICAFEYINTLFLCDTSP